MKSIFRLLLIFASFAVTPLYAGLAYHFESSTTGMTAQTLSGTVKADNGKARIEIATGDGLLFESGSVVLSGDGSGITVLNPSKKNYYQMDTANIFGGALSQFQGLVKLDARNTRNSVRNGGDGGQLEGYPTTKSIVDSSYDLVFDMLGQQVPARIETHREIWSTSQIPAEYANIFQTSTMRTGIEAVDKIVSAQTGSIKGFPLKQVSTTKMTVNDNTTTSTSTTRVTDIRQATFAPAEFTIPAGYVKTDSPMQRMLKQAGQ